MAQQQDRAQHVEGLAPRRRGEPGLQLGGGSVETEQVSAYPALRARNDETGGMDELVERRVVAVREADRLGDPAHRRFRPGQKMHAVCAVGMMVLGEIGRLRGRGVFRRVARVDADRDEAEVAAGVELQPVERRHQPAQRQAAERPAVQVFENQHDRLAGEKRRERTRARLFVIEDNGERQLGPGMRPEREFRRRDCGARSRARHRKHRAGKYDCRQRPPHGAAFGKPGMPCSATRLIASSIGMWTRPRSRSTQ